MDEHCRGCIRYLKSCSGLSKAVCEKHQLRIPRTNADRLRAMSDEELAAWLTLCLWGENREVPFLLSCTVDKWLDWLRQEGE